MTTTASATRSQSTSANLAELAVQAGRRPSTAVRHRTAQAWERVPYGRFAEIVQEVAGGLVAIGVQPGDRVAIFSNTRPEWTYADFGILCAGAVTVPVYQTSSPDECQYVLQHSGARVVICENEELVGRVREVRGELPDLEHVVAFEDASGEGVVGFDELRGRAGEVDAGRVQERIDGISPDDLATIVYTSGTTGRPKGCMLTHGNLVSAMDMVHQRIEFEDDESFYVFLPLAHVLTRIVQFLAVSIGAELAYWQGDPKKIIDEVQEVSPTQLPSVPRIFEKIYTKATSAVDEQGGAKAKLFHWAVDVGRQVREAEREDRSPSPLLKAQHALADRLVLHKIRDLFGNRIRMALTGAAPIDASILTFFHAAGVWVMEGYGMTETSSVATVNTIDEHRVGTVGKALPGFDIRIADDGEILMRGPNVFRGYYRNEEATRDDVVDGWLHSGDIGELDEDGYLTITGRKKDLIVTSSGKNITPSNIENALRNARWISQAVVFGDRKPYLTALITLDPEEAPELASKVGASADDPGALAEHEGVREEIQRIVDEANRQFARIEQVKRFDILERDLSQEEDELTPTLKIKRNVVYDKYADRFEAIYERES